MILRIEHLTRKLTTRPWRVWIEGTEQVAHGVTIAEAVGNLILTNRELLAQEPITEIKWLCAKPKGYDS